MYKNREITEDKRYRGTELYINRYYARKAARGNQITVALCGGFTNMEPEQYRVWRNQK